MVNENAMVSLLQLLVTFYLTPYTDTVNLLLVCCAGFIKRQALSVAKNNEKNVRRLKSHHHDSLIFAALPGG